MQKVTQKVPNKGKCPQQIVPNWFAAVKFLQRPPPPSRSRKFSPQPTYTVIKYR
jgi:hypothetical protein